MKFTEKELEIEARNFLREIFDMDLYVPVVISKQMRSTFGSFRYYKDSNEPIDIRISYNLIENYSREDILGTLKHECVHYALFMMGKPFSDGDYFFEQTLRIYGIPATRTKKYRGKVHVYECDKCKSTFTRKIRRNMKGFLTRCCNSYINYLGEDTIGISAKE